MPDMSYREIGNEIEGLLITKMSPLFVYVSDVYTEYAIVEMQPKSGAGADTKPAGPLEYYRVPWAFMDGKVTIGEPERVKKATLYIKFAAVAGHYEYEEKDGKYTIKGLPIFEAGTHRGLAYTEKWFKSAIDAFQADRKEKKYLPPVYLGHTKDDPTASEPPAAGMMDNLKLIGKTLYTDIVNVSKEIFDQISAGMWPYRSIETMYHDGRIMALALLGGSPPYIKTAPLHFSGDEEGQWVPFVATAHKEPEMAEEPKGGPTVDERFAALKKEQEEHFAEQRADIARRETILREKEIRAGLRDLGLAPAVVDAPETLALVQHFSAYDGVVRFADKDVPASDVVVRFMAMIKEQVGKNAFLPPQTGDTAGAKQTDPEVGDDPDKAIREKYGANVDVYAARLNDRAMTIMERDKVPYVEAAARAERELGKE